MSEKLCTLRTKGGGGGSQYTETSLWTNQNPSSSFAGQTVTLSEGMSNFKYLAIKYKSHYSQADTNAVRCIVSVEDVAKLGNTVTYDPVIRLGGAYSNTNYTRYLKKGSDTTINFGDGILTNGAGTSNNYGIPLEILGLNELDHGTALSSFEIMGISAGTSTFQIAVSSSDSTLMDVNIGTGVQTSSFTVKRNAKGKVYFFFGNRSSVTQYGTITFKGTTYSPNSYSASIQGGIDVEFSANDTISVTCGKSSANGIGMVFIEER